jgi:hypothetical protein
VLAELAEEVADNGEVSELTRQQMELALVAAAHKDDVFARAVNEIITQLRQAEQATGQTLLAGAGAAVFTGDAHARADRGGVAVGQIAGDMHVGRDAVDPPWPGRLGH